MKSLFPVLMAALFFVAITATAQDSEKERTKMEEVMTAHDQIMERMPDLSKLIDKLKTKADPSNEKQKYQNAVQDLKSANKAMMDWMAGFGNRFEADEMYKGKILTEQKQKWLLEEEKKLTDLREAINLSIEHGQKLLQE